MSKRIIGYTLLAVCLSLPVCSAADQTVRSLRGNNDIANLSATPKINKWLDTEPFDRQYIYQPPLIPHSTKGYVINKKFNKCLTCHSWANAKESGATKVSLTHFTNRDGHGLANISAARYFCTQCHVPQADVKPLIENTFMPIKSLQ